MVFWLIIATISLSVFALVLQPWRQKGSLTVWIAFLATMTLLTLILYKYWGANQQITQTAQLNKQLIQTKRQLLALGTRENVILQLEKTVHANPDNAKGWYLLAKLYSGSADYNRAENAMKAALKLEPENLEYQLALVDINFVKNKKLLASDKILLDKVLENQPGNINALNLFALDAYQQKHYKLAISYWQRVLTQIPADSEDAAHIRKMIQQASR